MPPALPDASLVCHATVLRPSRPEDQLRLRQLTASDSSLQVFDTLAAQLDELVQARHPADKLDGDRLRHAVERHLHGRSPDDYGAWVHFPWSHRLVHLLDAEEFAELRSDRNRNKITHDEQARLAAWKVGVVGLSVGRVVAVALALERSCGELRLADFDRLSLSNMNRLLCSVDQLGERKTVLAAREIAELDPYLPVRCFHDGLTDRDLDAFFFDGGKLDLIVDECDDLRMKLVLRRRARELGIPVVMDTSDRGLLDVERFDLEPGRPLLHGRADDVDPDSLRGLSTDEKVPFVLRILDGEALSPRAIASLVDVGQTLSSWPQLASGVLLGGAVTADAIRRIALGSFRSSGRFYVDVERIVCDSASPERDDVGTVHGAQKALPTEQARARQDLSPESDPQLRSLIEAAIRAPSGGNNQPWLFTPVAGGLDLHHDPSRSASFLDFESGAAFMSLGAAIENLVIAAHHAGLHVRVAPFPDASDPSWVARVTFPPCAAGGVEPRSAPELFDAIAVRCTNRKPGHRTPVPDTHRQALFDAVRRTPGARLWWLEQERELAQIGEVLGEGDRERFLSERLHAEMMSELRWTPEEAERTRDGIDVRTLEASATDLAGLRLCTSWAAMRLVRSVGGGRALEKMSRTAIAGASAVGLVTMPSATSADYVQGGRAMQRLWLQATACGLALQPMSSLPYLFARLVRGQAEGMPAPMADAFRRLRARYLELFPIDDSWAEVLLFRVTQAPAPLVRELRRPVQAVLRPPSANR